MENILAVLNRARSVEEMSLPGFRLRSLKGQMAGRYAVTVRANYRITFRFESGDALDVGFSDYHEEDNIMRMKNPPHPGRIVRQECIAPLKLSITDAAKHLSVTRQTLNNLVNERAGVSLEMAIRLSKAFGSSPEIWLGLQMGYDLALAQKKASRLKIAKIAAA